MVGEGRQDGKEWLVEGIKRLLGFTGHYFLPYNDRQHRLMIIDCLKKKKKNLCTKFINFALILKTYIMHIFGPSVVFMKVISKGAYIQIYPSKEIYWYCVILKEAMDAATMLD